MQLLEKKSRTKIYCKKRENVTQDDERKKELKKKIHGESALGTAAERLNKVSVNKLDHTPRLLLPS